MARKEFARQGRSSAAIAFVITDGVPANNFPNADKSGLYGNPRWWFYNKNRGYNPARYSAIQVPLAAQRLKASGVRIMMIGIPDVNGNTPGVEYFDGTYNRKYFNVVRSGNLYSFPYRSPPFPIVNAPTFANSFTSASWDVDSLVELTRDSLCQLDPPTGAPTIPPAIPLPTRMAITQYPTSFPTSFPTSPRTSPPTSPRTSPPTSIPTRPPTSRFPTPSPTMFPVTSSPTRTQLPTDLTQLDLTFLVDRSKSMNWRQEFCSKFLRDNAASLSTDLAADPPSQSSCWELWVRYMLTQADLIASIPYNSGVLGWYDDHVQVPGETQRGLRVHIIGFACRNNQRTPKVYLWSKEVAGEIITNRRQLVSLLEELRQTITPDGGTCPGLAIENSVLNVESTKFEEFPFHANILMTDGRFYDMPFPERAVKGLQAYKSLQFAVGIAVPMGAENHGLTPEEVEIQRKQLNTFVEPYPELLKNAGELGWALLDQIAMRIATDLPSYISTGVVPKDRYTWCGWKSRKNCRSQYWRKHHCRWRGWGLNYKCRPRN